MAAVIVTLLTMGFVFAQASFAAESGASFSMRATGWEVGTSLGAAVGSVSGTEAMITEEGVVQKVEKVKGDPAYLQMTFKGETGNLRTVFLGPKWFIDNQKSRSGVRRSLSTSSRMIFSTPDSNLRCAGAQRDG